MNWVHDWRRLADEIEGLREAADQIFRPGHGHPPAFMPLVEVLLFPQAERCFVRIEEFSTTWGDELPNGAAQLLRQWQIDARHLLIRPTTPQDKSWLSVGANAVAALTLLRAEMSYHLANPTLHAIGLTERAIQHLQWLIASDEKVRGEWCRAFQDGETRCEELGGTHLLHHGIWAFKANTPRQKTDLVLGEPVLDSTTLRRAARALVLTEWKRVVEGTSAESWAEVGRDQASIYAGEALAGFELEAVRYVILVSMHRLPQIDDVPLGGVTYRHLNVAVDPRAPHVAAKRNRSSR